MASQIVEFFNANYELIYSTYKGSYNSIENTMNGVTPDIGYSSVLKIWIDLFHTNPNCEYVVESEFVLKVGNIYQVQASNFCFILVVIDVDTVIYCGNYGKFDCRILTKAQADELVTSYKSGDANAIAHFHDKPVGDLEFSGTEYVEYAEIYPIDRVPNLETLLEVCFFSEDFRSGKVFIPNEDEPEFKRIVYTDKKGADYNNLLRQYYTKWMSNFNALAEKIN